MTEIRLITSDDIPDLKEALIHDFWDEGDPKITYWEKLH